jgi:hypothetical protein
MVHLLQLLGLLDQHSEFLPEIDLITILSHLHQDLLLEELHGALHDIGRPGCILALLVHIHFLNQFQVFLLDLLKEFLLEFLLILVELDDGTLHAGHERFCPADDTCHWRLAPADDKPHSSVFVTGLA